MALAFLFEDGSVMYMDAVESYTRSYSSSISRHPIDKSAKITDHVAKDNPSFSLKGIVSSADFNISYTRAPDYSSENVMAEFERPVSNVEISQTSSFLDYLPGSVQQFLSSINPTKVTMDEFRGFSHQVARERLNRAWEDSELITLLDYDYDLTTGKSISIKRIENCLISNYTDSEDVDTGDAFEFTITLEKVRFAYIKEVDIRLAKAEVADSSAKKSDKGDQTQTGDSSEMTQNKKTEWQTKTQEALGAYSKSAKGPADLAELLTSILPLL